MKRLVTLLLSLAFANTMFASEADLIIPDAIHEWSFLHWGFLVTILGFIFGMYHFFKTKNLPVHGKMLEIGEIIYKTCSAYLKQQGKFLATLFIFIGVIVAIYFGVLAEKSAGISGVLLILFWTIVGILGSYGVAAYGIRMNTFANARMAFASLKRQPLKLLNIP